MLSRDPLRHPATPSRSLGASHANDRRTHTLLPDGCPESRRRRNHKEYRYSRGQRVETIRQQQVSASLLASMATTGRRCVIAPPQHKRRLAVPAAGVGIECLQRELACDALNNATLCIGGASVDCGDAPPGAFPDWVQIASPMEGVIACRYSRLDDTASLGAHG